jgi:hypothetical protein
MRIHILTLKKDLEKRGGDGVGGGGPPLIFGCLLEHVRDSFGIDSLSYILNIVCRDCRYCTGAGWPTMADTHD